MFLGNQTDSQPDKKADTVTDEDRVNSFVSDVSNNEEPDKKADSGAPEQEQNAADDSQKADDAPEQEQSEDVADQPQSEDVTEQSQGSEEASEDAADNKDKRKPKPLSQRLKEINDATREMREAERRANEAISRLQKIQGESSPELTDEKTSDNKTSEGPDPKKFEFGEFDPLYLEERAAWRAEQKFNELQAKEAENRQAEAAAQKVRELQDTYYRRLDEGAKKYDDFKEVVIDGPLDKMENVAKETAELLIESDYAADILYHFSKNPDEALSIVPLPPRQQERAILRLEAKFAAAASDAPTEKKSAPVSKAPAPPTRARGTDKKSTTSPDTTDFGAFKAKFG